MQEGPQPVQAVQVPGKPAQTAQVVQRLVDPAGQRGVVHQLGGGGRPVDPGQCGGGDPGGRVGLVPRRRVPGQLGLDHHQVTVQPALPDDPGQQLGGRVPGQQRPEPGEAVDVLLQSAGRRRGGGDLGDQPVRVRLQGDHEGVGVRGQHGGGCGRVQRAGGQRRRELAADDLAAAPAAQQAGQLLELGDHAAEAALGEQPGAAGEQQGGADHQLGAQAGQSHPGDPEGAQGQPAAADGADGQRGVDDHDGAQVPPDAGGGDGDPDDDLGHGRDQQQLQHHCPVGGVVGAEDAQHERGHQHADDGQRHHQPGRVPQRLAGQGDGALGVPGALGHQRAADVADHQVERVADGVGHVVVGAGLGSDLVQHQQGQQVGGAHPQQRREVVGGREPDQLGDRDRCRERAPPSSDGGAA